MINYRAEIIGSWVRAAPSTREVATLLGLAPPVSVGEIIHRLRYVERKIVSRPIHTNDGSPINGRVTFELRSDGSYVFSGHMRATGAYSYHYGLQAWVRSADGTVVAAQETGRVFGTDTPGPRQDDWSQPGHNLGIKQHWRSVRDWPDVDYNWSGVGSNFRASPTGVLGSARDVFEFFLKGIAAARFLGPWGWYLLIGTETAHSKIGAPGTLLPILVAGGTFLLIGPYGLVPAVVAGAITASLVDVRDRPIHKWERDIVDRVFRGTLDYDRIRLTNLTRDGGRKFAMPSIGSTILVNIGDDAFDDPTGYMGDPKSIDAAYPDPGSLFVHELTHAWQITHRSYIDLICGLSDNYTYYNGNRLTDLSWHSRSWSGFNNEQQASIINDWYGAHYKDLGSFDAINDPAFRFIRDNIRMGINR